MGFESENPLAFLDEAEKAINDYQATSSSLAEKVALEKSTSASLDQLKTTTKTKIEKTLTKRSQEIAETYDRQLTQLDAKIKKVSQSRDKAKNLGIKGRIQTETEPLTTENKELKRQCTALLKKDSAPSICDTGFFYTLFMPSGIKEILGFILSFLIMFALIPISIYYFIPDHKTWYFILIYVVDILVFGGLYVFINNMTKVRHRDVVGQCRDIRKRIRANVSKIRAITHAIKTDSNESGYKLEDFDDELSKAQMDRADIISKKQAAQNTFETVTKNIITDEIETAVRPQQDELIQQLSAITKDRVDLENAEKEKALDISKTYEAFIGKSHMNSEDIAKLRDILSNQEATTIIAAVAKLEHPDA